jgi:hypothetical protein
VFNVCDYHKLAHTRPPNWMFFFQICLTQQVCGSFSISYAQFALTQNAQAPRVHTALF